MSKQTFDNLMEWRCIGPFRGGRVVTVAGDSQDRNVFYFGACAGGVWKTDDGGTYWTNISDGYFKTGAVGALAVAESDPNVIYAGMGESTIRIDVSHGDGVYKTTDGGRSWKHMGLSDTRHIGKIRIHPTNPDIVYVAALGHAFGPNSERGVFKSTDGGETWKNVLFKSDKAGAVDLSIDPNNPRIIYATIWEAYRNWWMMSSGGPESGLYRSMDGGETWEEISENKGLPKKLWGKAAVAVSPAKSGRVWALIECEKNALYRSDDNGDSWKMVSDKVELMERAWYYTHLTADSTDSNTIYVNNLRFWKSTDGGRNFDMIMTPHGDNHDLWLDPADNQRMIQGNDGGANVSYNGGVTWSTIYNQPTAQFYRMDVDNQEPYRVYGTQQDNSCISIPSRSNHAAIAWADCYLPGTGESGYIAVKPDDPNIVYHGAIGSSPGGGNALQRYDHRNRQLRLVTTWPRSHRGYGSEAHKYRFSWTYPLIFSRFDSNRIYAAGNHLFETTNEGHSWEIISPDLSTNDPEKQKISGGPVNREMGAAEIYCTIFALDESYHDANVLWAGTDDGLIHVTQDRGKTWQNITPEGLPDWAMVHCIEASPHEAGGAYVAATCYKLDDNTPYLFKTSDFGQTWTLIAAGIPADDFTRVIRCDPARQGLLYAGTETGVYVSFDDGANWSPLQLNLPQTPIYDMKVKNEDLVVATHGRSFWILDDVTPLRQYVEEIEGEKSHLFAPRTTVRVLPKVFEDRLNAAGASDGKFYMTTLGIITTGYATADENGVVSRHFYEAGNNPPKGAILTYYLKDDADWLTLEIKDSSGDVIRTYTSKPEGDGPQANGPFLAKGAGWHRFVWNLRYENVSKVKGDDAASKETILGAVIPPGSFTVCLTADGETHEQPLTVVKDYGVDATDGDLQAQFELYKAITDKCEETVHVINQMRDVRAQLDSLTGRVEDEDLIAQANAVSDKVLEAESMLAYPGLRQGMTDSTNKGQRLLDQLAAMPPAVYLGDYRPTVQAKEVFDTISAEIDEQSAKFVEILGSDLAELNLKVEQSSLPMIIV
ncbi:MAG: glycosyl hydrolase [Chloroflexota bacterium]